MGSHGRYWGDARTGEQPQPWMPVPWDRHGKPPHIHTKPWRFEHVGHGASSMYALDYTGQY